MVNGQLEKKMDLDPVIKSNGASHKSEGKPAINIIDPGFLIDIAKVMSMGEAKYGKANWMGGGSYESWVASALRHIEAFNRGENLDQESGLPHLAHAAVNCLMIEGWRRNSVGQDDRRFKGWK